MNKRNRTRDSIILAINVLQVILFGLLFYFMWLNIYHDTVYFFRRGNWLLTGVYMGLFALFASLYDGFSLGSSKTQDLMFSQSIAAIFSLGCIYLIACFVNKTIVSIQGILLIAVASIILILITNAVTNKTFTRFIAPLRSIYIYSGTCSEALLKLKKYQTGFFNVENSICIDELTIENIDVSYYECVFVSGLNYEDKRWMMNYCYQENKPLYIVPTFKDIILQSSNECNLIDTPLLKCNLFGPSQFEKIIKRSFDIIFSLVLIFLTSPIMLLVAFAIKCEDGGPVFYKQVRLTQYKKEFNILKFRSMRVDAEKNGVQFAKAHDDRITKVGRFIRACRLDELPQLLNILKGEMSVVGPRPERPEIQNNILKELPEFDYRLKVKAGLTGFAQVYGKYNTTLSDKLLFDLIYIENYSLFLDIKIMFLTFKILFSKESTEGYE